MDVHGKQLGKIFMVLLVGILFTACDATNAEENDLYISFNAYYVEQDKGYTEVLYFDLADEKVKQVAVLPSTSQYPLAVFDKQGNVVYYTARIEESHKDEVFAYALDTKQSTQLTDDFYAVNAVVPYENQLFITAMKLKDRKVHPFLYEKDKKTLQDLSVKDDMSIALINYNPVQKEFITTGYSSSQMDESMQNQDEKEFVEPVHTLYQMDETSQNEIVNVKDKRVLDVAINSRSYFYSVDENVVLQIDRATGKETEFLPGEDGYRVGKIIYVTEDNRYIYHILNDDIWRFDMVEKKNMVLYACVHEGVCRLENGVAL